MGAAVIFTPLLAACASSSTSHSASQFEQLCFLLKNLQQLRQQLSEFALSRRRSHTDMKFLEGRKTWGRVVAAPSEQLGEANSSMGNTFRGNRKV